MAVGFPSPLILLLAWIVGFSTAYDATKDCTFEFYNRSVYGATRNPGCEFEHVRTNEYITFDLLNFGAETIKLGVYQNYSNGGGVGMIDVHSPYESLKVVAECSEPPILEFGTDSCTLRFTGKYSVEMTDSDQLLYSAGTCHPDVHYVECTKTFGDCGTPPCRKGVYWQYDVDRVKGCPFFHNDRNDTIGKYTGDGHPKWWFAIWNMDKPEKADPIYRLLSDYDFFMWDFDENGDMEMPDFFVRKLNNPQCTYFQLHLVQP